MMHLATENGSNSRAPQERIEHAIEYVRDLYSAFRRRGHKTEMITKHVAAILGIGPRRVRAINYREHKLALSSYMIDEIEDRFIAYIDHEIKLSIERTERLRADKERATLRRGQWRYGNADSKSRAGASGFSSGRAPTGSRAESAA